MKKLIIFFTTLCFISCLKEEPYIEPEIYNGIATAKVNGENFEWSPRMSQSHGNNSTYLLRFDYLIEDMVLRKTIYFRYVKKIDLIQKPIKDVGTNKSDLQCGFTTNLDDGDVIGNIYHLDGLDDIDDYIQLTSFDESTGMVTGQFQASFVVDPLTRFDPSSPDTIVITDGYFETTLFD